MGLKTTNYEIKNLGITLPQAYAIIKEMHIENGSGYAKIAIQTSRENAFALAPIETVKITFTDLKREEHPYEAVYTKAKAVVQGKKWNTETGKLEDYSYDGPFTGWMDDIVQ